MSLKKNEQPRTEKLFSYRQTSESQPFLKVYAWQTLTDRQHRLNIFFIVFRGHPRGAYNKVLTKQGVPIQRYVYPQKLPK